MATLEDQLRHEAEMHQLGIERYYQTNNRLNEREAESNSRHGRVLIASLVAKVAEGVEEIKGKASNNRDVAKKKLANMNAEQVAYIAMVTVVDVLSQRRPLLYIARQVGIAVEMQSRLDDWIVKDPQVAKRMIEQAQEKTTFNHAMHGLTHKMNKDGHQDTTWGAKDRIHVGLRLIDQIILRTGLVTPTKISTSKGKTTTYLEATPQTINWIRSFQEKAAVSLPRLAPCLIKPKPWTTVWDGGYYSGEIQGMAIVRAH